MSDDLDDVEESAESGAIFDDDDWFFRQIRSDLNARRLIRSRPRYLPILRRFKPPAPATLHRRWQNMSRRELQKYATTVVGAEYFARPRKLHSRWLRDDYRWRRLLTERRRKVVQRLVAMGTRVEPMYQGHRLPPPFGKPGLSVWFPPIVAYGDWVAANEAPNPPDEES